MTLKERTPEAREAYLQGYRAGVEAAAAACAAAVNEDEVFSLSRACVRIRSLVPPPPVEPRVCDWCHGTKVEQNLARGIIKDIPCHKCAPSVEEGPRPPEIRCLGCGSRLPFEVDRVVGACAKCHVPYKGTISPAPSPEAPARCPECGVGNGLHDARGCPCVDGMTARIGCPNCKGTGERVWDGGPCRCGGTGTKGTP